MLVLALDTTTRAGSCAVARDGVVLRERDGDPDRPHDTRMPGDLMTLLEEERLTLPDVDVFAVATGPGSFTGLRVGIATMQGLAYAEGQPLIGVSAFDALVRIAMAPGPLRPSTGSGRPELVERRPTRPPDEGGAGRVPRIGPAAVIATWVDAWRGEVYAALYEHGCEVEPPTVEHPNQLLDRYSSRTGLVFIGGAAQTHRDSILAALGDAARIAEPASPLLAGTIAVMAGEAARAGSHPPPHAIRPLYVRRPGTEPARDARPVG